MWIGHRLSDTAFIFNDPELEALFNEYMAMNVGGSEDTIDSGDEESGNDESSESNPAESPS
jgi:hypothetical protein